MHENESLLRENEISLIGFDNLKHYYDINLKFQRLDDLTVHDSFNFIKGDLANRVEVDDLFATYHPEIVINLGAQAGVRYSTENPQAYIQSNIIGFFNILEACRQNI